MTHAEQLAQLLAKAAVEVEVRRVPPSIELLKEEIRRLRGGEVETEWPSLR